MIQSFFTRAHEQAISVPAKLPIHIHNFLAFSPFDLLASDIGQARTFRVGIFEGHHNQPKISVSFFSYLFKETKLNNMEM